jgi:hypothetical protein
MSEPKKKSSFLLLVVGGILAAILVGLFLIPLFVKDRPVTSSANTCINNLRNIDIAKNEWALINHKRTNDLPTWEDIKPYLKNDKPYFKFDSKSNLPLCPSGGKYTIGKIGEPPTCSLGATVTPAHVLQ